jgi:hypothetical protein
MHRLNSPGCIQGRKLVFVCQISREQKQYAMPKVWTFLQASPTSCMRYSSYSFALSRHSCSSLLSFPSLYFIVSRRRSVDPAIMFSSLSQRQSFPDLCFLHYLRISSACGSFDKLIAGLGVRQSWLVSSTSGCWPCLSSFWSGDGQSSKVPEH